MRLLVAENDEALGVFLRQGLEAEHYSVDVAREGASARPKFAMWRDPIASWLDAKIAASHAEEVLRADLEAAGLVRSARANARARASENGGAAAVVPDEASEAESTRRATATPAAASRRRPPGFTQTPARRDTACRARRERGRQRGSNARVRRAA